jgi:predicted RNA binding protein YcfA (HicA-like mRNA interferase family)
MAKGYYRQVCEQLTLHGWGFHRNAKGDHELWSHPDYRHKITVDGVIKSRALANAMMKQAGINHKF